jgi:hypothetical protein
MSYQGAPNWPPSWTWRAGPTIRRIHGEVGTLKEVVRGTTRPMDRIFLIIQLDENEYLGTLLFEDLSFCRQIYTLLLSYCGHPLSEIGDPGLSHLL